MHPVVSSVTIPGPMAPETAAYTLARYSRSPDSFAQSLEWVSSRDSQQFLETYYFDYGHASIADLGHLTVSFENISELAALEVVDEPLWDGQQKSTRYQDFSKGGYFVPQLDEQSELLYRETADHLLKTYSQVQTTVVDYLTAHHPRPSEMKEAEYRRRIAARAFDTSRFLLFLGIPTQVGQVTSIRVLERQLQRLGASLLPELRELSEKTREQCKVSGQAPTLAKYLSPAKTHPMLDSIVPRWIQKYPFEEETSPGNSVELVPFQDDVLEIAAGLIYPYVDCSYFHIWMQLMNWFRDEAETLVKEVLDARIPFEELPRAFRSAPFSFEIVTDIGAYRDLHRHRRTIQLRQQFGTSLGFALGPDAEAAGVGHLTHEAMQRAHDVFEELTPAGNAQYILPFGTRCRSVFKMDYAEALYISEQRSGVKGHPSYREIAYKMKTQLGGWDERLASQIRATPPEVTELLTR